MNRNRVWTLAAGVLAVVALLAWWSRSPEAEPVSAPVAAAAPVLMPAPEPVALPASAAVPVAPPAARAEALAAPAAPQPLSRAQRMRADWCGKGASEAAQDLAGVTGGGAWGEPTAAQRQAMLATDGGQLLEEARLDVRQRWVQALQRRNEPRTLAFADYLLSEPGADAATAVAATAHLQGLARSSTDPLVSALALRRPCRADACRSIEITQWSRLEPDNIYAWMVVLAEPGLSRERMKEAFERMAASARYSRSYQPELSQLLVSVLQFDQPGLGMQAETDEMVRVLFKWTQPLGEGFAQLNQQCTLAGLACEPVLRALWQDGDMVARLNALMLAGEVVPPSHVLREPWEGRAKDMEAVQVNRVKRFAKLMQEVTWRAGVATGCSMQVVSRREALIAAPHTDWERDWIELSQAGTDREALSRQWRAENGRTALDSPGGPPQRRPPPDSAPR